MHSALPRLVLHAIYLAVIGLVTAPLTYRPALKTTLKRALTHQWTVQLQDLEILVNDTGGWTDLWLETTLGQHVTVEDTIHALQGRRPSALDRVFTRASQSIKLTTGTTRWGQQLEHLLGATELSGSTVEFRLEDEGYTKSFKASDDAPSPELLAGLTEDMDLRVLLPDRPVRVGDRWNIDPASLLEILSPGGYFAWTIHSGSEGSTALPIPDPALMGDLRDALGSMLDGRIAVEYADEEGGVSHLALSIDVSSSQGLEELSALADRFLGDLPDWGTIELTRAGLDFSLKATGSATWDSNQGHIAELKLSGSIESELDMEILWDAGMGLRIEVSTEVAGDFEQSVAVE